MTTAFRLTAFLAFTAAAAFANPITWTLTATFADGGTASGTFTYDYDTNTFSNWNVSAAGGNTTVFPPFDFTPTSSVLSFNSNDPTGLTIAFVSFATFPDPTAGTPENLVLGATLASPLTDALGAINISPSAYSYECYDCGPSRAITNGTLKAVPGNQTSQTITFGGLSNVTLGSPPFMIGATASSGLPVTFVSATRPVCTVSGNTVTIIAAGACTITAYQGGSATYAAAPSVTQSFTVVSSLTVTPTTINFQISQPFVQSQPIQIGGIAGLAWQATSSTLTGGAWLSLSSAAGQIPATLTALANSLDMSVGTYQGNIIVQAPDALPPASLTISVTLTISASAGPGGQNQVIVTVAGSGTPSQLTCGPSAGPCGPAFSFGLHEPNALGFDAKGNLYIGQDNNLSGIATALLQMAPSGTITTATAGINGFGGGPDSISGLQVLPPGVPATLQIALASPFQMLGPGSIYVSDYVGEHVDLVGPGTTTSAPVLNLVAGSGAAPLNPAGTFSGDGGLAIGAAFNYPWGVAVDQSGNLYIADSRNNRIRQVSTDGIINTIAGSGSVCEAGCGGFSGDGGPASQAQLNNPTGITVTGGNLYIADTNNRRIRKVSPIGANGIISTVASNLEAPDSVAVDQNGDIYVGEPFQVVKVSASGALTTIAGNGSQGYSGDGGPPANALVNMVAALALDANGNLYIADSGNNRVRMIVNALTGVQNAASYMTSAISPGEIVVLYGAGIGPATLAGLQVDSASGLLETTIAGTTVLFNGIPAPIIYSSENQVSVVVPYEIASAATAQILVNYQGNNVAAGTLAVAPAVPGIFTASSGTGQAAALNQDGSVNSASNPAAAGSTIVLFLTGEGQTTPAGTDGKVASAAPYPTPVLPVTVSIGGQTTTYSYAGAAPGEVAGVMQINAIIPAGITGSAVPVSVQIGAASAQRGVTIAVQ